MNGEMILKVAIIGAGVSGLSCAHELEKNGIEPVIFERNSFIGEQITHVASFLEVTHRPIKDVLKYIHEKYDIEIQPLNTINTLIHKSPNKTTTINGDLGYFVSRGRESNDLKNQLYAKLKSSEMRFNENVHYDKLKGEYDYVIIGSGEISMTEELGCWKQCFQGYERGATVLGSFDPNTQIMWVNRDYCKSGYAFLAPFDSKRAFITLVVSDVNDKEIDYYWEEFIYTEKIKYTIVEEFKIQHFGGFVYPHKVENIYFVGNAGGAIDSFLGFGQFNSISMGVLAARSIVDGSDYEESIKDIVNKNKEYYRFRKAFNTLENDDYDKLISSIGMPGIKDVLYHSPFNIAKYGAKFLKLTQDEEV